MPATPGAFSVDGTRGPAPPVGASLGALSSSDASPPVSPTAGGESPPPAQDSKSVMQPPAHATAASNERRVERDGPVTPCQGAFERVER
jgi:hypothetical protein